MQACAGARACYFYKSLYSNAMNKKSSFSRAAYEAWLASPQGAFVLHCQQALTRHMLAAWPRRGRSLLHCHCGTGLLLRQFWQHGFEVTGYEPEAALRALAYKNAPHSSDIEGGSLEHLPFDDDSIDFAVLSLPVANSAAVLRELWRVSRSGLLLLGWNSFSLAGIRWQVPSAEGTVALPPSASWWQAWCTLKRMQPQSSIACASTLLLPSGTWHEGFFAKINQTMQTLPCGAFAALRCDFAPSPASPSLPLSLFQSLNQPRINPVMERQQAAAPIQEKHNTACTCSGIRREQQSKAGAAAQHYAVQEHEKHCKI